jgi:predicted peptidase
MKPIRSLCALLSIAFLSTGVARAADDQKPGTQTALVYEADGKKMGYLLFLPGDYGKEKDKKIPVIFFLHGSGEAGDGTTQIQKVAIHGPPKIAAAKPDSMPFIVISPQNPPPDPNAPRGTRGWQPKFLKGLLDDVMKSHPQADPKRIYLTGLSMGGMGSWRMAAEYPDTFAAVAPVCGFGNPESAEKLKNVPIWAFHGEKDTSVPIDRDQAMVDAVKAAGAKDIQFTRYPDKSHDCWTVTYDNPKLYEWFLKHSK